MRKFYLASVIAFSLMAGACVSGKPAEKMPGKADSGVAADVRQPGTNMTTEKRSNGTASETGGKKPDGKGAASPEINAGITVNKIKFDVITENVPEELQSLIDSNVSTKGYCARENGGVWYVAVFMGEQLTSGYSVEVKSIEDNEGRTGITVEEVKPAHDEIVLMSLTYPFQIVRITDGIAPDFIIVNQDGEEYSEIQ